MWDPAARRIEVRVVGFEFSRLPYIISDIISATYWYEKKELRPKTASKMALEPAMTGRLADESRACDHFIARMEASGQIARMEAGCVKLRSFQSGREMKRT